MAHKTLTISEEAYDALAALKKEGLYRSYKAYHCTLEEEKTQ